LLFVLLVYYFMVGTNTGKEIRGPLIKQRS
jgi:hypothetical protein